MLTLTKIRDYELGLNNKILGPLKHILVLVFFIYASELISK